MHPVYSRLETVLGISVPPAREITRAILGSARFYGWHVTDDFNALDTERIGATPSSIAAGRRVTSYSAMIRSEKNKKNLTVAARTRVASLLFDGRRVSGIKTGGGAEIRAGKEVIVCAGAVETPLLLERSGIGRPDIVRSLGTGLVAESPQVGERLIEQRGLSLQVRLSRGAGITVARQVAEAVRYAGTRGGLLATGGYDLVCQFKSRPEIARPDIQGLFAPLALDTASEHFKAARHPGILFMGYPIRPTTASSVHSSGRDPASPPVIDARCLETESDRDSAAPVLEIARAVLGQGPVAGYIESEEFPGPSVTAGEQAIEYSRQYGGGIYHAVGSAAMGPGDADVTDPRLRVRGVRGLRIADASVLPAQVSGNTAAPAMAVGWRAADFVLEENE
jgi:choline dehydrogenase-like flavoprotein